MNRESGWELSLTGGAQDLLIRMARGHCVAREAFESASVAAVRGSIDYLDQHFYEAQRIEYIDLAICDSIWLLGR